MGRKKIQSNPAAGMPGYNEGDAIKRQFISLKSQAEKNEVDISALLSDEFGFGNVEHVINLKSADGTMYTFHQVEMGVNEVEERTYIEEDINGREQILTLDHISDISSMEYHQYFALFGVPDSEGKIFILDGSRRRKAYLHYQPDYKLKIWVSEEALSPEQAKWFAKDIQTAKPKTIRDQGVQLKRIQENNPDVPIAQLGVLYAEQYQLPKALTRTAVNRSLAAASLPIELIQKFSLGLSVRNYEELSSLFSKTYDGCSDEIIEVISSQPAREPDEEDDDYNLRLIRALKEARKVQTRNTKQEVLPGFNSRKSSVNKVIKNNGVINFETKGLDEDKIKAIENAFLKILQES